MHKFTIFTIIFSIVVIFVVADLVLNDYWGTDFAREEPVEDVMPVVSDAPLVALEEQEPIENDIESEEETVTPEAPINVERGRITIELLRSIGVAEPRMETSDFDGLVYGFWDVRSDFSGFTVFSHQIFDGPDFMGSAHEIKTEGDIQTFGAYETLRQLAQTSSVGAINENNSYGDASFYFNHYSKTNTVFLVVRQGQQVYALQYAPAHHATMRTLIEAL